jgi:hypothetical protein
MSCGKFLRDQRARRQRTRTNGKQKLDSAIMPFDREDAVPPFSWGYRPTAPAAVEAVGGAAVPAAARSTSETLGFTKRT